MQFLSFFVGAGFPDESLPEAEKHVLDFIGADAGSIDVGPCQLGGTGKLFSDDMCRRDLRHVLKLARARNIPLLVGSSGGCGNDAAVDWFADIVRDLARELDLSPFKLARIYSEPDRDFLCEKIERGEVKPLGGIEHYTAEDVHRSSCIVGVMGPEPFIAALEAGADVILAGRTTDAAIFAAMPIRHGFPEALSWHAGKVSECGGAIGKPSRSDLLRVRLDTETDSFEVEPMAPDAVCTSWSVAAHQLYENADPFLFTEPPGTMDATDARFDEIEGGVVRISGARFHRAPRYTMKLEGVEPVGYQSISLAVYNDPVLLEELPDWLDRCRAEIDKKVQRIYGEKAGEAKITVHVYGDGQGAELFGIRKPSSDVREAFFLIDVVAPNQQMATSIATIGWHTLIHFPPAGWKGSFVTAAWPFNPPVMDRGPVHRFNVNHVVELDDPLEPLRFAYEMVGRS